jgi:hypothetical protein
MAKVAMAGASNLANTLKENLPQARIWRSSLPRRQQPSRHLSTRLPI